MWACAFRLSHPLHPVPSVRHKLGNKVLYCDRKPPERTVEEARPCRAPAVLAVPHCVHSSNNATSDRSTPIGNLVENNYLHSTNSSPNTYRNGTLPPLRVRTDRECSIRRKIHDLNDSTSVNLVVR